MTTVTAEQASEMASDLRDSADLLSAEHGPKEICEMEWQAADMIEAQAARIAELEAQLAEATNQRDTWMDRAMNELGESLNRSARSQGGAE